MCNQHVFISTIDQLFFGQSILPKELLYALPDIPDTQFESILQAVSNISAANFLRNLLPLFTMRQVAILALTEIAADGTEDEISLEATHLFSSLGYQPERDQDIQKLKNVIIRDFESLKTSLAFEDLSCPEENRCKSVVVRPLVVAGYDVPRNHPNPSISAADSYLLQVGYRAGQVKLPYLTFPSNWGSGRAKD